MFNNLPDELFFGVMNIPNQLENELELTNGGFPLPNHQYFRERCKVRGCLESISCKKNPASGMDRNKRDARVDNPHHSPLITLFVKCLNLRVLSQLYVNDLLVVTCPNFSTWHVWC